MFKVITKILVDRLAQVVPYTISHQKSGFIHGRKISASFLHQMHLIFFTAGLLEVLLL